MLDQLWDGDQFLSRDPRSGELHASRSLLNLLPLTLGDRLPEGVRDRLAAGTSRHLTTWGLATEPVSR